MQHSPSETYESIILRLLETKVGAETVEYVIYDNKCENCWVKVIIDWSNPTSNVQYLTRDGDVVAEIPVYNYEDNAEQNRWDNFKVEIEELDNIRSMCAILEEGQTLHLGNLGIKRL